VFKNLINLSAQPQHTEIEEVRSLDQSFYDKEKKVLSKLSCLCQRYPQGESFFFSLCSSHLYLEIYRFKYPFFASHFEFCLRDMTLQKHRQMNQNDFSFDSEGNSRIEVRTKQYVDFINMIEIEE